MEIILLLFIFTLAAFLGFELISKVPSQLHTPLMSGSNAISGITIVGALLSTAGTEGSTFATVLGAAALVLATINVVGGYMVTDRMLAMFIYNIVGDVHNGHQDARKGRNSKKGQFRLGCGHVGGGIGNAFRQKNPRRRRST